MMKDKTTADRSELRSLLELSGRVGRDPLLTQASTGNSSAKLDGVLWIKASGKWMADAMCDDILLPLNLKQIRMECLGNGIDPSERYPHASTETAMHAALPHRFVLHVHCVNTIAWAIRKDARAQLRSRLEGLRWEWVPYTPSGLPLSRAVEQAIGRRMDADVFVLGNHGLVIGGADPESVNRLLAELARRLSISPRVAPAGRYSSLHELCEFSRWTLPDDPGVHALGTDPVSQKILAKGLLYPCQAIFSGSECPEPFRPVAYSDVIDHLETRYRNRLFLIVEGYGVIMNRAANPAEIAMLGGLAQVVQRVNPAAPLRYLTPDDLAGISGAAAYRYRELAGGSPRAAARSIGSLELRP
jgi:rhamnose utilization protein RhaD (predicted bifunctional aldolase and dehydrogenase)